MLNREDRDGIALVTMERAPVNALDSGLCTALAETFLAIGSDDSVRAVVLTGRGRAFSAGVDLWRILDGGAAYTRPFVHELARCFDTVLRCPKPTVAAVNGHAL